jgi:hypothetical protein
LLQHSVDSLTLPQEGDNLFQLQRERAVQILSCSQFVPGLCR